MQQRMITILSWALHPSTVRNKVNVVHIKLTAMKAIRVALSSPYVVSSLLNQSPNLLVSFVKVSQTHTHRVMYLDFVS